MNFELGLIHQVPPPKTRTGDWGSPGLRRVERGGLGGSGGASSSVSGAAARNQVSGFRKPNCKLAFVKTIEKSPPPLCICLSIIETNSSKSISPLLSESASAIIFLICSSEKSAERLAAATILIISSVDTVPELSISNFSKIGRSLARSSSSRVMFASTILCQVAVTDKISVSSSPVEAAGPPPGDTTESFAEKLGT